MSLLIDVWDSLPGTPGKEITSRLQRGNRLRSGVLTLGNRRHQAAPGDHKHDLVGELHWLIGTQVAPDGYAALDGVTQLTTYNAPKLFKLWGYKYGGSGNLFTIPDMRDRFAIGQGDLFLSGNSDGYVYQVERTAKAIRQHNHPNNFSINQTGSGHTHPVPNRTLNIASDVAGGGVKNIPNQATHDHPNATSSGSGHNHGLDGNVNNNVDILPVAMGALPVVLIQ